MLVRKNTVTAITTGSLSDLLPELFSFISTEVKAQMYIMNSRIEVDGKLCLDNKQIQKGQEITVLTPQSLEPKVNLNYQVLFEDEDLLIINKPAPLPVHTGGQYYFNTLLYHLQSSYPTLHPVHRIDRETSGVLILAKNKETAQYFFKQFKNKTIGKEYVAIVFGKPNDKGTINLPLQAGQHGEIRDHMLVTKDGKPCITHYELITTNGTYSLLKVVPESGRRHQIRAHLQAIGHPIVGDKQYGANSQLFVDFTQHKTTEDQIIRDVKSKRQFLHNQKMSFIHPKSDKKISIIAKLEEDMLNFLKENHIDYIEDSV